MYLKIVSLALVLAAVCAEVIEFTPCEEVSEDICSVSQVRIDPCDNVKTCKLVKGKTSAISFDFTPNFSATSLKSTLFWASPTGDVPFSDMHQADGCQYTGCPVTSGQQQELNYSLRIDKKLPNGIFTFKWKLENADNENQVCCFKTKVQIRRK